MKITVGVRLGFALLAIVLAAVLTSTSCAAQGLDQAPFAGIIIERDVVTWDLLPDHGGSVLTVTGPEGTAVAAPMESLQLDKPHVHARLESSIDGRTLRVRRSLRLGGGRVESNQYSGFRSSLIDIVDHFSRGCVFR